MSCSTMWSVIVGALLSSLLMMVGWTVRDRQQDTLQPVCQDSLRILEPNDIAALCLSRGAHMSLIGIGDRPAVLCQCVLTTVRVPAGVTQLL